MNRPPQYVAPEPPPKDAPQGAHTDNLVFLFPGQSSRYREMLQRAQAHCSAAAAVIAEASDTLGRDLAEELSADQPHLFADNRRIQIAVFLTSHMYLRELNDHGIHADLSLGLSLGEYNHLVEIEALDFAAALRLVDERGRLYADAASPAGVMISLFPADEIAVAQIVAEVGKGVAISNFNSPSQLVIAGPPEPTARAAALFEEREFGQANLIESQIPMHTAIFRPVAERLRPALAAAPWKRPKAPYFSNVTGARMSQPGPKAFIEHLYRHVHSPVQWRRSIEAVLAMRPNAIFVEVGPRRVLCNLLGRQWVGNERMAVDDAGLDAVISRLHTLQAAKAVKA